PRRGDGTRRRRCRARLDYVTDHILLSSDGQKLRVEGFEVAWFTSVVRTSDVFDLLRDGRPRTRAQLAESTGLARSTIAARVDVLMRLGLVAPYGDGRSTGGRPPSLFALNPAARVVVGVDVGATHAVAAMCDLSGKVLSEHRSALDVASGPEEVLGWVSATVGQLLAATGRPVVDL